MLVPPNLNCFLTCGFIWLGRGWGRARYFTFPIGICSNTVCLGVCLLLCLSTAKDQDSLFYAHLQRSFLCSRKIGPRKFKGRQRKNITKAHKNCLAHVSGLQFTLMCHKQISQHQARVGLNVHRIENR